MKRLLLAATLATLGAALAVLVASSPARAWDITNLPAGYSTAHWHDSSPPPGSCGDGWNIVGFSASISLGECDPAFQQKLDAFIDSTCPCAITTTSAQSTIATSSTNATTTNDAGATTAAVTSIEPPPPAPPPAQTVAPTTISDTVSAEFAALAARITALEQQIAALSKQVDRLVLAGDASWLAYQQAIANGDDPGTAADIARGTWLNAVYGLGAFAP